MIKKRTLLNVSVVVVPGVMKMPQVLENEGPSKAVSLSLVVPKIRSSSVTYEYANNRSHFIGVQTVQNLA